MISVPLQTVFKKYGTRAAARALLSRAARRLASTEAIHLMSWEWGDGSGLEPDPKIEDGVEIRRLTVEDLAGATDPELDLDAAFVREVLKRGDHIWGAVQGSRILAYQCFSSVVAEVPGLGAAAFPSDRLYVYKVLTTEAARGKRLHRRILQRVASHYRPRGFQGFVTYINALNEISYRAFRQAGFETVAIAVVRGERMLQFSRSAPGRPWLVIMPDPTLAESGERGISQPPPTMESKRAEPRPPAPLSMPRVPRF